MSEPLLSVWPPLPLGVYARRSSHDLPFPLPEPMCRIVSRARHGLWWGVRALGLQRGDVVLAPAYHHGSEIEAFVQAGLVCAFYEGSETLEPDEAELKRLLSPRVRALHLIHYLGFPQDASRWRRWCDERRLLLIEDAAQAWLATVDGRPVGSWGDLSVHCLYKTFGLPDGAAAVCRAPLPNGRPARRFSSNGLLGRHAAWLAGRSGRLAAVAERLHSDEPYSSEKDFALGNSTTPPSASTMFLLPRVVDPSAAARRRAHYALLLDELADRVPPPFSELPPGASPFALPIATNHKARLLDRLRRDGVVGLDFWSVPHPTLPTEAFPAAAARRAQVVALPVHQELLPAQVERIARAARGRTQRGRELHLETFDSLEPLKEEWTALAGRTGNVFSTWEWASVWWRHFGNGRTPAVTVCRRRDNGRVVAVLPLFRSSRHPLEIVRFIGSPPADELGPVCSAGDRAIAARALRETLEAGSFDVFLGEQLPANVGWGALLGAKVIRRTGSPVLRFHGRSWDDLLASWSANLRQQVRRRERKLAREHDLRFRLTEDAGALQRDLDILFRLHAARWQRGGSSFHEVAMQAFHREFAAVALERGWLRLRILELGGTPVAAWYGFRFDVVESYYQAGWDPAWQHGSVGFVLLAHSMRAALQDGASEYRFLEGSEGYKYRFATEDPGLETIGLPKTALGSAALTFASALGRRRGVAALGRRLTGPGRRSAPDEGGGQ